jgi:hypothetical protein
MYAYVASTLAFYSGMRACEIQALHWQDIDFGRQLLHIRRSKTPAGWRSPTLNATCLQVLQELHDSAEKLGFTQPGHFVFPWHGRDKKIDPKRSMTSWRGAWRNVRKAAGLPHVRFHDGRHTAITTLAEKGLPDWVIQAQVGHVSSEMMKTYSHIRRQALNEAAAALEPTPAQTLDSNLPDSVPVVEIAAPSNLPDLVTVAQIAISSNLPDSIPSAEIAASNNPTDSFSLSQTKRASEEKRKNAMAQSMAQNAVLDEDAIEFVKENGSSGRIRTYNPPVNSVTQVFGLAGSSCR